MLTKTVFFLLGYVLYRRCSLGVPCPSQAGHEDISVLKCYVIASDADQASSRESILQRSRVGLHNNRMSRLVLTLGTESTEHKKSFHM